MVQSIYKLHVIWEKFCNWWRYISNNLLIFSRILKDRIKFFSPPLLNEILQNKIKDDENQKEIVQYFGFLGSLCTRHSVQRSGLLFLLRYMYIYLNTIRKVPPFFIYYLSDSTYLWVKHVCKSRFFKRFG